MSVSRDVQRKMVCIRKKKVGLFVCVCVCDLECEGFFGHCFKIEHLDNQGTPSANWVNF